MREREAMIENDKVILLKYEKKNGTVLDIYGKNYRA